MLTLYTHSNKHVFNDTICSVEEVWALLGRESIPEVPISNPNLQEKSSRTGQVRVLGLKAKTLQIKYLQRLFLFQGVLIVLFRMVCRHHRNHHQSLLRSLRRLHRLDRLPSRLVCQDHRDHQGLHPSVLDRVRYCLGRRGSDGN